MNKKIMKKVSRYLKIFKESSYFKRIKNKSLNDIYEPRFEKIF